MPDAAIRKLSSGDLAGYVDELKLQAARGDVTAMFYLGRTYEEVKGIPHDYVEAMKWYRLAAERRSGPASWSIGRLFEMGEGKSVDVSEAQRWYRRAVELGFRRTALTQMYLHWFPGPEPLFLDSTSPSSSTTAPTSAELDLLRAAGVTGRLELRGARPGHFGLPARVLLIAQRRVSQETTVEVPEEGTVIYLQRDSSWEKLPGGIKTLQRKLVIGPQSDRPDVTVVMEELEGGGMQGGMAFSWPKP